MGGSSDLKRAGLTDVARVAGVSTATVSRVLNEPGRVAEGTRARVMRAIDELNFVRNATAVSFKVRQTHNILVMVANIGSIYYSEVFEGLQRKAEASGYAIMMSAPTLQGFSREVTERLRSGRVDGVIVLDSAEINAADLGVLKTVFGGTPPLVGFSEQPDHLSYPHVFANNRLAVHKVVRYLASIGHTRIAHLTGTRGNIVAEERLAGFVAAMKAEGLELRSGDVIDGGFSCRRGAETAGDFIALKDRPTAVFCSNDEAAMGFISALVEAGLKIPEDVSIVGFDDIGVAAAYVPPLTTVYQPRREIGAATMDLMLEVMRNPAGPVNRAVEIELDLVIRKSTAPPKNH